MKIVISHGSGGIGTAETFARDFFESKGYEVHLIDYFTPHGIRNLAWGAGKYQDHHDCTFSEMFKVDFPEGDIIHIGFSLGAFLGIINHERFVHNYLFYPGCIAFTQSMLEKDYTNASVIVGTEDTGQNKYNAFKQLLKHPPAMHYYLAGAHHAFMITDIDRQFDMVRYGIPKGVMDQQEFDELKPNHKYLSERYGHKTLRTILKSNNDYRMQYLTMIEEEIREHRTKV